MPDYTVKADVDTMLRANDKAGIRSAIGVGTTDAPTFLAQTLTGQSLTGTQATSLVDLSATWNTTGTPSALKLNVIDTASNSASNLMDLQVGGVSRCKVSKAGNATFPIQVIAGATGNAGQTTGLVANGIYLSGGTIYGPSTQFVIAPGVGISQNAASYLAWGDGASAVGTIDAYLYRDAAGILAQRNGTAKQALRVYNTALSGAPEWGEFDWITSGGTNTLRIGTNLSGTGAARPIDFVTGGVVRMSIAAAGNVGMGVIAPRTKLHLEDATVNPLMEFSGATVPLFTGVGFTPNVGTTTTARIGQLSLANGGLAAYGFTANTNLVPAILFQGHLGSTSPTVAAIQFVSYKHDGSAARTALASTEINSQWLNGTTVLMTLLGGGNVGIGTIAPASKLQVTAGDIEVDTIAKGVILKSPDGTRYRVTAANGGTLSVTAV